MNSALEGKIKLLVVCLSNLLEAKYVRYYLYPHKVYKD